MFGRRISHVLVEAELRVSGRHGARHQAVAADLRDDRGGGNGRAPPVASDHPGVLRGALAEMEAVDQAPLSAMIDSPERLGHQAQVGAMEAVSVDPPRRGHVDRHAVGIRHHRLEQLLALLARQSLGVVEVRQLSPTPAANGIKIQAHRRHDERTGEASTTRLVGAGDKPNVVASIEGEQSNRRLLRATTRSRTSGGAHL
jgi:hypothetical protein